MTRLAEKVETPAAQLTRMFAARNPEVSRVARAVRAAIRKRLPTAVEFVYDKPRMLVIGYGPNDRPSDAILSIVLNPNWVTLCFIWGVHLPDPDGVLSGGGNQVRHVRLGAASDLATPSMRRLIEAAIREADPPFAVTGRGRTEIRLIAAPRPAGSKTARSTRAKPRR